MEVLAERVTHKKVIQGIITGKEEVTLPVFADYMILYTENPKDLTRKLLGVISEFSKHAGNKIKIHKVVALLYTNEISEKDVTIAQK